MSVNECIRVQSLEVIGYLFDEARFNQDLSNIDTFGLDETSVAKGHDL